MSLETQPKEEQGMQEISRHSRIMKAEWSERKNFVQGPIMRVERDQHWFSRSAHFQRNQ